MWREDRQATLQQHEIRCYNHLERIYPQPGMPLPPPPSPPHSDRVSIHPPLVGPFCEAVDC